jgi:hypothetical protein
MRPSYQELEQRADVLQRPCDEVPDLADKLPGLADELLDLLHKVRDLVAKAWEHLLADHAGLTNSPTSVPRSPHRVIWIVPLVTELAEPPDKNAEHVPESADHVGTVLEGEHAPRIATGPIRIAKVAPEVAKVASTGAEREVCIPALAAGVAVCLSGVTDSLPKSPAMPPAITALPATSPILPIGITASSPGVLPFAPVIATSSSEVADLVAEVTRRAPLCAELGAQDSAGSPSVGPFGA